MRGYDATWFNKLMNSFITEKFTKTHQVIVNVAVSDINVVSEHKHKTTKDHPLIEFIQTERSEWKHWNFRDWVNHNLRRPYDVYVCIDSNKLVRTDSFTKDIIASIDKAVDSTQLYHMIHPLPSFYKLSKNVTWLLSLMLFSYYYLISLQYVFYRLMGPFHYMFGFYRVGKRSIEDIKSYTPDAAVFDVYKKQRLSIGQLKSKKYCSSWSLYYIIKWVVWTILCIVPGPSIFFAWDRDSKERYLVRGSNSAIRPKKRLNFFYITCAVWFYSSAIVVLPKILIMRPWVGILILVLHIYCCIIPIIMMSRVVRVTNRKTKLLNELGYGLQKISFMGLMIMVMWIIAPIFLAFYYSYRKIWWKKDIIRRFEVQTLLL